MAKAKQPSEIGPPSKAYHWVMASGFLAATTREAIKDVRNMFMQVFFGQGERGGEPGTLGNPLFHTLVETNKFHASFLYGPGQAQAKEMSAMASNPNQPSVTAAILENPQSFLANEKQNGQDMQQQNNAMGQESGSVHGVGQDQSVTAAILDNPQSFLGNEQQQNGQDREPPLDHDRDM
jgi:hypothetical protein